MILQEFLVLEAVGSACDHADAQCLYQNEHRHDGVRIRSIEHQDSLNTVSVDYA